jgi:hypothetical protein
MSGITNQATKIARQLFWINLLPSIVASAIFLFSFFFLVSSGFKDTSAWLGISLGPGVAAQFVYYKQMVDDDFTKTSWGWWYSMILNALIIVGYIVSIFVIPSSSWFLIIYPIFFFSNSCAGLQALKAS